MKKWGLGAFGLVAIAGVVALGASVFGGVAQAQEPPDTTSSWHDLYQQALADKLGITVDALQSAQESAQSQVIDDAVAAGRITQDQADKLRNAQPGDFRRGFAMKVKGAIGDVLQSAADILGLSTEEVRAGLADGKSLNDLAAEQGVSNLEAQLVAKLTADIQAKVADGSITQDQADRLMQNLTERVASAVDMQGGKFRDRIGGFGGFGGRGHFGGQNAPSDQAPSQSN
jgi:polyhydroxyalkanoate synthesis regulator phasin